MRSKDEREVITTESVKADLLCDIRGERFDCIMYTIYLSFMILLIALTFCLSWGDYVINAITVAVAAFFIISALFFAIFVIVIWYRVITEAQLVKRGGFKIVKDTLKTISEDEFSEHELRSVAKHGYRSRGRLISRNRGVHIEDAFYFSNYGRAVAHKSVSNYSMSGDEFYLAVYPSENDVIVRMYSSRIYRFDEGNK